jgi:hypothetical protein
MGSAIARLADGMRTMPLETGIASLEMGIVSLETGKFSLQMGKFLFQIETLQLKVGMMPSQERTIVCSAAAIQDFAKPVAVNERVERFHGGMLLRSGK